MQTTVTNTIDSAYQAQHELGALEFHIKQNEKYLKNFLYNKLWDKQETDDMYQMTLLEAVKSWSTFQGRCDPKYWLVGIAHNLINKKGQKKLIQETPLDEIEERISTKSIYEGDPSILYEWENYLSLLEEEINLLPKKLREVVVLIVYKGLSYEQAAQQLEIPVGTIRSRLYHARSYVTSSIGRF